MEKIIREISMDDACLHMRECGMDDDKENRTIEGRAIVFGVRSVNLTPWHPTREVYEVMEPGCINQELIDRCWKPEELVKGRYADSLEPVFEKTKKELGDKARSDEDVLSYIAFPQVAEKFFAAREEKESNTVSYTIEKKED